MLAHNQCKWPNVIKCHAVRKDVLADDKNCMTEQTIHTNRKLGFLTTKTSQKTHPFVHLYMAQCPGMFGFCYI